MPLLGVENLWDREVSSIKREDGVGVIYAVVTSPEGETLKGLRIIKSLNASPD